MRLFDGAFIGAVAASLLFVAPASALADDECDDAAKARSAKNHAHNMRLGRAAEAGGRTFDAHLHYEFARQNYCVTDANKAASKEADAKALVMLASRAEAAGRLFDVEEKGISILKDDERCKTINQKNPLIEPALCNFGGTSRWEANPRATAYQWLKGAEKYADAIKVIMKVIRARPEDIRPFPEAKSALAEHAQDQALTSELKGIISKNITAALEREEKTYKDKTFSMTARRYEERSLGFLEQARDWQKIFDGADDASRINSRASKRGDEFVALPSAPYSPTLYAARKYYEFAKDAANLKGLKGLAEKRGDEAFGAGDFEEAKQCFRIAENRKKESEAEAKAGEVKRSKTKDEKTRKKFKKDADALEKELGI